MLKDITGKLAEKKARMTVTDAAKDLILETGYDVQYGARPLKRAIQTLIEDKLAKLALTGKITENSSIVADRSGDEISITVTSFEAEKAS